MQREGESISSDIFEQSRIRDQNRQYLSMPKQKIFIQTKKFMEKVTKIFNIDITEEYLTGNEADFYKKLSSLYDFICDEKKTFEELSQYFEHFNYLRFLNMILQLLLFRKLQSEIVQLSLNILSVGTDYGVPDGFYKNENLLKICFTLIQSNSLQIPLNIFQNGCDDPDFAHKIMPTLLPLLLNFPVNQEYAMLISKLAKSLIEKEPDGELMDTFIEAIHKILEEQIPALNPDDVDPFDDVYYVDSSILSYAFKAIHHLFQWASTDIAATECLKAGFGPLLGSIPVLLCAQKNRYFNSLFRLLSHFELPIDVAGLIMKKALTLEESKWAKAGKALNVAMDLIDSNLQKWGGECSQLFIPFLDFISNENLSYENNFRLFRVVLYCRQFVTESDLDRDRAFLDYCFAFLNDYMITENILQALIFLSKNQTLLNELSTIERIQAIEQLGFNELQNALLDIITKTE